MTAPEMSKNMKLLAQTDLGGFGNVGEGMVIQLARDGRRILWLAHESAPKNVTAVDVTDPRTPSVVLQTELPHGNMRSNSLDLAGDLLVVAYQTSSPGLTPAGVAPRSTVWYATTSVSPERSSEFERILSWGRSSWVIIAGLRGSVTSIAVMFFGPDSWAIQRTRRLFFVIWIARPSPHLQKPPIECWERSRMLREVGRVAVLAMASESFRRL